MKASVLDWWPSDAIPNGTGNRLLIGIAVWSGYYLNMLDMLEDAIRQGQGAGIPVGVVDIDQLLPTDIERLLPELGVIQHSPVVGYGQHGKLVEKACGFHAREIVCRLFGLDPKAMIDCPVPVRI